MRTEPATEAGDVAVSVTRHRFSVDDYYRMAEAGILRYKERVELIEGEIVDMAPVGRRHAACVDRLNDLFARGLGDRAIVRVQGPLRLHHRSEPQPDLVVLRRRADFYARRDARPEDAFLVIEVADTTERYDRLVKVPMYARAGIPEVWLVDLTAMRITAYREPSADGYAQAIVATGEDELSPLAFPDFVVSAARILG
jgi:Uma2 family endonuclease